MIQEITIGLIVGIGGTIIGYLWKINRCVGTQEGRLDALENSIERIANALLRHLDRK